MSGPCWLTGDDPVMTSYHDTEWGRPVIDERGLYERMSLEGFQSGLSWRTVLNKRPAFREVYANFDPRAVADFGPDDVERLLLDARIIRHRRKIEAVINNAQALLKLWDDGGSLAGLFWAHAGEEPGPPPALLSDLAGTTPVSAELSKRLRKLGFAFVGPTTAYAAMQACGIVNDHLTNCPFRAEVEAERTAAIAELSKSV
jgi:DNA-3-methyladenine glycosylase I